MFEYFAVLLIFVFFSVFYYKIAIGYNILDVPNNRSTHKKPVVRGLGVLFLFSFILFFITSKFSLPYVFIGLSIISIISFIDDVRPLNWSVRLFVQILGLVFFLIELNVFENYEFFFVLVFIITGVLTINFYNFMDGINGLLFLNAFITFVTLYVLNFRYEVFNQNLVIYPFFAIVVFGFFNFRKNAIAFAGDVGSVFLGGLFFYLVLLMILKTEAPIISLLVAVYFIDAGCTLLYRLFNGENIFKPHRLHMYEKLVDFGCSHRIISIYYAFLQLCVSFIIFRFKDSIVSTQYILLFSVVVILMILYFIIFKTIETKNNTVNVNLKNEN